MPDLDTLLQQALDALENGEPLEKVLATLPQEAANELAPLLTLASSIRTLPQPELSPAQTEQGREKVDAAARDMTLPASVVAPAASTAPSGSASLRSATRPSPRTAMPQRQNSLAWNNILQQLAPRLGAVTAVLIMGAVLVAGLAFWLSGPKSASAARLIDVSGQVEVASTDSANDWKLVENGDIIRQGERLRTAGASSATLVFFEGSRTTVGSDADLTLRKLDGDWGNVLKVQLYQRGGKTANSVVPFKSSRAQFVVDTPSGSATVHGTKFNVEIGRMGQSRFAVNSGKVLVVNDQSQVYLNAGQTAASVPGEGVSDPTYLFNLTGKVTAIDASQWTVNGVNFTVNDQTAQDGTFTVGSTVAVEGQVLADGSRVANSVSAAAADDTAMSSFTGVIQSMSDGTWQIGGNTVRTSGAEIAPDLKVGDAVKVNFSVENGIWQAIRIAPLAEPPAEPTPAPTHTPDPNAKPSLEFRPEEISSAGCGNDFTVSGTLVNQGEAAKDSAADVELGYYITKGGEYVSTVELTPSNWSSIAAGQSATFNLHVTLMDGWQKMKEDENEVKVVIYLAHETNRPDHLKSRLTVSLVCGQEQTPTPEPSATPEGTVTPEVTPGIPGASPSPAGTNTSCTGANPQPEGMRLAQRYGVPYEEIMGWFCQGFGFGEIDLAYSLSRQHNRPVAEIFAMKQGGMGWGNIKKALEGGNQPGGPKVKPTKKPKK